MSTVLPEATQAEIDAGLERLIGTATVFAIEVGTNDPELSREVFAMVGELVKKRSRAQVERMEARLPEPWGAN